MIVAGASAYPREIRFDLFAEIAKEVGAYLFVDMAHIAGLVAAGLHQNPVLYADVVSTTTHKHCEDRVAVRSSVKRSMQNRLIKQFSREHREVL